MSKQDYNAFQAEYDRLQSCAHPQTELRVRRIQDGRSQLAMQCLACGRRDGEFVSRKALQGRKITDLPHWDTELEEHTDHGADQRRKHAWDEVKTAQIAEWKKEYDAYLLSDGWDAKRRMVFERCGGICEGCRKRDATQVHHLHYDHLFDEFLFELVAVCKPCHIRLHPEAIRKLEVHFDIRYIKRA